MVGAAVASTGAFVGEAVGGGGSTGAFVGCLTGESVGGLTGESDGGSIGVFVGVAVVGVPVGVAVGAVVGASAVHPQAALVMLTLTSQTSGVWNPNLVDFAHSAQVIAIVALKSVMGAVLEGFERNCSPQALQGSNGPGTSTHPPQAAIADLVAAEHMAAGIRPFAAAFS